jgi:hypothetical protein
MRKQMRCNLVRFEKWGIKGKQCQVSGKVHRDDTFLPVINKLRYPYEYVYYDQVLYNWWKAAGTGETNIAHAVKLR